MKCLKYVVALVALCFAGISAGAFDVGERVIRIAASNALDSEKAGADYVCTGKDDQDVIQKAFDELSTKGGGTVSLTRGTFYIDNFRHKSSLDLAAIEIPQSEARIEYRLIGDELPFGSTKGTTLYIRDEVYEAMDPNTCYTVLRASEKKRTIDSNIALVCQYFRITNAWNQKKFRGIDLLWVNRIDMQGVTVYNYRSGYKSQKTSLTVAPSIPVEGSFGIRSTGGSNNACFEDYRGCTCCGFYEGFQFAGEHVVGVNLSAVFCVYGYSFGNFAWTCGSNHPITLINCCDERNVNLPLFAANGEWNVQEKYGYSGQQAITFIDFNIERIAKYAPGKKLGEAAKELHPGTFRGSIEYTIQDIYSGHGNCVDMPFWEPGSGYGMKTRNQAQLQACDTKTRLSYAPNYMQYIYDTDLQKVVYCIDPGNKLWIDALGNKVD